MTLILNLRHKRQYSSFLAPLPHTCAFGALSLHLRSLATMKPLCWRNYTEIEIEIQGAPAIPATSYLDFPAQVPDM